MQNKKETIKIRRFFTKALKDDNNSHAWYNTYLNGGKLSKSGIQELQDYINKKNGIYKIIIANNIEGTRPQRTWGCMPGWARPESEFIRFDDSAHDNSFVFVIYNSMDGIIPPVGDDLKTKLEFFPQYKEEKDGLEAVIKDFIESFPEKSEVIVLSKKEE